MEGSHRGPRGRAWYLGTRYLSKVPDLLAKVGRNSRYDLTLDSVILRLLVSSCSSLTLGIVPSTGLTRTLRHRHRQEREGKREANRAIRTHRLDSCSVGLLAAAASQEPPPSHHASLAAGHVPSPFPPYQVVTAKSWGVKGAQMLRHCPRTDNSPSPMNPQGKDYYCCCYHDGHVTQCVRVCICVGASTSVSVCGW